MTVVESLVKWPTGFRHPEVRGSNLRVAEILEAAELRDLEAE